MPIIEPTTTTPPLFYPKSDYTIAKYMDITKFISFLKDKSLFFCRLDKLEDKFEGTTTKLTQELRFKKYDNLNKSGLLHINMTDDEIRSKVKDQNEFEKQIKAISCVNCWNKYNHESAALWKIYSNLNNGIMIKSSISLLKKSLAQSTEQIQLSEIHYINYNKDYMSDNNSYNPVIHKHIAYDYEDELRLIYRKMPEYGWTYDWDKEKVQEGVFITCDPNTLIEEIVISPFTKNEFFELAFDISQNYGIKKPFKKSELSIN